MDITKMEPSPEHWDKVWSKTRPLAPHDTVLASVSRLSIVSALEVGAGSGRDLEELHRSGYKVVFTDFSLVGARRFSTSNKSGIPVLLADCRHLPFRDNSFDLVFSLGLLEHFEPHDRQRIIQEQFRVARRFVLIDVPQTLSLATVAKKIFMALGRWPYGQETQFTFQQLIREVHQAVGTAHIVGQYGRELIPLPRNRKWTLYSRLPSPFKRAFIKFHSHLARAIAGSFGIVLEKAGHVGPAC